MKFINLIILSLFLIVSTADAYAADEESVYDRVMRTGKIRCGYVVWPPYLLKDPNTGEFSGLSYDYMKALAEELDLQVEWTEEVGWGNFGAGLDADRYDMMCVGVWQSGQRARAALLSRPIYFNSMFAYAREDDDRFDNGAEAINDPGVKIVVIDGDITQSVRRMNFPQTQEYAVPEFADSSQLVLSVATKKADITFEAPMNVKRYNENAEVKLKMVGNGVPMRVFGNVYAYKKNEFAFKHMMDTAIEAINTSGVGPAFIAPYEPEFKPIAAGYRQ